MLPSLTKFSDADLLQIFKADVRDEVDVFIPILHQDLVILAKAQVRQPVCQIGLKHTDTGHGSRKNRFLKRLKELHTT